MEHKWIEQKLLINDLIQVLEEHPHVLRVTRKYHFIKVKFDTGITEYWALTEKGLKRPRSYELPLTQELFAEHEIQRFRQFETNKILYPEDYEILKSHFIIKRKDLDKAGWCNIRFKVHDIAAQLSEEGYIPIKYTTDLLDKDLLALQNENLSRYQIGITKFSAFSSLPPSGRRLIMHFMPCYAEQCWDFFSIYNIINKLVHRDFTREDIVYYLSKKTQTTRHPAFYRALFKQWLDVDGKTVYDLCPNWGFKALATIVEGGHYFCNSVHIKGLQEMGDYIGGEIGPPDLPHYDLIIVSDANPVEIDEVDGLISKYGGISERMLITVRIDTVADRMMLTDRYKPERALRINNNMIDHPNDDNMIMIIKS